MTDLQNNGLSVTSPKGWSLVARGANTITMLILASAAIGTVYYVRDGFAEIKKEHAALTRHVAEGNCIQTLTPGERQALNFNKGASWKRFCWWMPDE